jgi:site-specific DNA-methyltransferase (adenine-specific)
VDDVRLLLGDCLDRMGEIEDGTVDLVCCDLPYGSTECAWDQIIPFEPLWAHYRRLLKPLGAVVLMANQPFTSMLVMSNLVWFRYCWVWEKRNGANNQSAARMPIRAHEDVVVFSGGLCGNGTSRPMRYYPQGITAVHREKTNTDGGVRDSHRPGRMRKTRVYIQNFTGYPRSVLYFPDDSGQVERLHPTQKPVALMEYLIRTYSNEGDLVLDNACGSGTTLVAARQTNRRCIGIEKDPEIHEIARRRLEEPWTLRRRRWPSDESMPLFAGLDPEDEHG